MRAYLSGPITAATPEQQAANIARFAAAEDALRAIGHNDLVNPTRNGLDASASWEEHMREDIKLLMTCDTIVMLDGWANSRGACIEHKLAKDVGIKCVALVVLLSAGA